MFGFLTQSILTERIGWVLVHSLWQFALVALFAFALQRALPRRSANARYWALLAAMFVLISAPVATWFSPWSAETPKAVIAFDSVVTQENVAGMEYRGNTMTMAALPEMSPAKPIRIKPAPIGLIYFKLKARQLIQPRLFDIALLWLGGILLAAFRPLLSWRTGHRLRTVGVSPAGGPVQEMRNRMAKRLRLSRTVEVLQSALVKTPMVVGCFRPVVLLPLSIVTGLPAVQLELILAHELAHIRRHDHLINLLQTLTETIFFYHPAVWWLSRQIRSEREHCCDDAAMACMGSRADYGRALLAVEELRAASASLSLAARSGSLVARIRRITDCEPVPRVAWGGSILCVILLAAGVYLAATADAAPPAENSERTPVIGMVQAAAKASGTIQPSWPNQRTEIWPLTLKEVIHTALCNSQVMRSIGLNVTKLPKSSASSPVTATGNDNSTDAQSGDNDRVLIARLNTDISQVDFEAAVRNLILDTEMAYWELYFHHRSLDATIKGRDRALETWRKVHSRQIKGTKDCTTAEEAQAREQYDLFQSTAEKGLSSLHESEAKLRYLMGLAATDGRLICPSEEPATAKVTFDWTEIQAEALRRNVEIRRQKWQMKRRELEVAAAKGFETSQGHKRDDVGLRNAELALTKEQAAFQEAELELSHQTANAIRNLESDYHLADTNFNRRLAAERQLDAVKNAYEKGTIKLDVLLQAQCERAQVESDYYRAIVNYVKSIALVHYRKGSLLDIEGVCLAEETK